MSVVVSLSLSTHTHIHAHTYNIDKHTHTERIAKRSVLDFKEKIRYREKNIYTKHLLHVNKKENLPRASSSV